MNKPIKNFESEFFNDNFMFIETPMIKDISALLHRLLWNGSGGAFLHGPNRVGKSIMIKVLQDQLENRLGEKLPVFSVSLSMRDVRTIASIFRNLCYSLGIKIKQRASADEMSNLVYNYLGEAGMGNSTRQVVLFVDEMQFLNIVQVHAFAELYNLLKHININLTIFFVGNTLEAEPLIDVIDNGENELVRARFFLRRSMFNGISSKKQLKKCLALYDENIIAGYNKTCTEYFLESDFKKGWLLASITPFLWEAFTDYKKIVGVEQWPMQYFTITIRVLLADLLPNYVERDYVSLYKMCATAIRSSNWHQLEE